MHWGGEAAWGLAAGVALALLVYWVVRGRSWRGRRRLFMWVVALTHLPYLAFALIWRPPALGHEALILIPFLAAALAGGRWMPLLLGLGLAAHSLVDIFHPLQDGPAYAPHWYRWACISFDWLLGGYALWALRDSSHSISSPR
ncbi:MAG TPA: hypothetical protein VLV83_13625 [Acidobacteriota bacterium]|nr:hypothetical protein [Acidobacteriota bacterium]